MIEGFIENWQELGVIGVLIVLFSWLVWYLVRSLVSMFKNELVEISKNVKQDSDNTEKVEETMNKLDHTIRNDLFHVIEADSKNTIAVKDAIKDLTIEIKRMNEK